MLYSIGGILFLTQFSAFVFFLSLSLLFSGDDDYQENASEEATDVYNIVACILKGRKRNTCDSDDSYEDSDQEESDDDKKKKPAPAPAAASAKKATPAKSTTPSAASTKKKAESSSSDSDSDSDSATSSGPFRSSRVLSNSGTWPI